MKQTFHNRSGTDAEVIATLTAISQVYRVQFGNELYDILVVDHMNFKRKCIKLSCQKVRR